MNGMYSDTSNFGSRELEPNSNTLFNISGNNTETGNRIHLFQQPYHFMCNFNIFQMFYMMCRLKLL